MEHSRPQSDPTAAPEGATGWFSALNADESGATLTEFIVVLPVFILIFAGIMKVTLLQSSTVQLKMAATTQLWDRAISVQQGERQPDFHTDPFDAGPHSQNIVRNTNQPRTFSDAADRAMATATSRNGLTGRAARAVDTPFGQTSIENQARLAQLPPSTGPTARPDVDDIVVRQRAGIDYSTGANWTKSLVDGTSTTRRPPQAPPPLNAMQVHPSGNQSVPAFAAGVRYGLITSDKRVKQSVIDALPGYSSRDQLRAGYDTLAAPVPTTDGPERFRPVGMARRFMERHPGQLSELLGVDMSSRYLP